MNSSISFLFFIYLFLILNAIKIAANEFRVINNAESFKNLVTNINTLQSDNNDLIVKFDDQRYNMENSEYRFELDITSNITFSGNEHGTVLDYNNQRKGGFLLNSLNTNDKKIVVKFENFIFENYYADETSVYMFTIKPTNFFIDVIYNNCTFQNNNYEILIVQSQCGTYYKPSVIFNNCNF